MKKTIRDYDLFEKRVLIRCDFNVPMKDGVITDDYRIQSSLDTIRYALDHHAKVILLSHLGRIKEESDKTIEYLNSLPIKRSTIVLNKVLCGLLYIVLMVGILGIFNYIGLSLSGEFDKNLYILLSITPIFSSVVIYFGCMFLSTFTHKTKKMLGISLGIVLISYVLQVLSSLAETTEFLKYFSAFTLADIRNVIMDISINPLLILISIGLSVMFLGLTIIRYNKKELV